MTPSEVARRSRELAAAEVNGHLAWMALAADGRGSVVYFIREQLLRLLENPLAWIPGSIRACDGDRLDVTISFDLSETESFWAGRAFDDESDLLQSLQALIRKHSSSSTSPPTSTSPSSPTTPPTPPPTPAPPSASPTSPTTPPTPTPTKGTS